VPQEGEVKNWFKRNWRSIYKIVKTALGGKVTIKGHDIPLPSKTNTIESSNPFDAPHKLGE
jgi:hypothetical protein